MKDLCIANGQDSAFHRAMTPLMRAATRDDVELIDVLMAHGADINAQNEVPLWNALSIAPTCCLSGCLISPTARALGVSLFNVAALLWSRPVRPRCI